MNKRIKPVATTHRSPSRQKGKPEGFKGVKAFTQYGMVLAPYDDVIKDTLSNGRKECIKKLLAQSGNMDTWKQLKSAGFTIRKFRVTCIG